MNDLVAARGQGQGYALAILSGVLDALTIKDFNRFLDELLESDASPDIAFDLGGLRYANSAGLAGFLRAMSAAHDRGGRVVFLGANEYIRRLFIITRIIPRATLAHEGESVADALRRANASE